MDDAREPKAKMKTITKLWIFIAALAFLSPLGILLPEHFKAGAAWGEWGIEEIKAMVGYIPHGLQRLVSLWNAPIPDYAFKGWEDKPLVHLSASYIISAVIGIVLIAGIMFLMGKALGKKE